MRTVNKVTLIGHARADAETRMTPNSKQVTNLNLATSEKWKSADGTWQEKTDWHRVIGWDFNSSAMEDIKKGDPVYIEGKIQTRSWDGEDGKKHYLTEIVASNVIKLSKGE